MKIKGTIFQRREWEGKTPSALSGELPHRFYFAMFPSDGKAPFEIESKSDDLDVVKGAGKYDKDHAVEVDVVAVFDSFKQRMKFVREEDVES